MTIVEALLALTVVQVAIVGVAFALSAGQAHAGAADTAMLATDLAEQLMERILALPYDDPDGESEPGPDRGESWARVDNVDDYHGYEDEAGDPDHPDAPPLHRRVTVTERAVFVDGLAATFDGLMVTVTVESSEGLRWSISRFVAKEGA